MNELYFLGMDIVEETKILANLTTVTCTDGMTESELSAYKLGVANTLSALKAALSDSDIPVINVAGLDVSTELSVEEVAECYEMTY